MRVGGEKYICEYMEDVIQVMMTGNYKHFPNLKFPRLFEISQVATNWALDTSIVTLRVGMCWGIWMRPELQNPNNRDHLLLLSSVPYKHA